MVRWRTGEASGSVGRRAGADAWRLGAVSLWWSAALGRTSGASCGLLADLVLGEPPAVVHPVARFGQAMSALEHRWWRDDRSRGMAYAAVGVGSAMAAGAVLRTVVSPRLATGAATAVATGGRALAGAAREVAEALEAGDLAAARLALPALVGRDPSGLDEKEIARAVVESVAENTADAVVAPALWAAVAGAPGVLTHRAANTLDAMVGYRSDRHRNFGWASARLDDGLAWPAARLTAALVALVRPRRAAEVWTVVRRDAGAHPSPNAGVTEAAFAAALGLRLGGENRYGDRTEDRALLGHGATPAVGDIARAVRLQRDVTMALAGLLMAPGMVAWWGRHRRRNR
jgi:adenosylcobinamide-phosphate synthase